MDHAEPETAELQKAVARIRWAHRIDLGHGVVTPGLWDTPQILNRLRLPEDLRGQSVLDIGCWDGFYSFEAERRGARRVVAADSFTWQRKSWGSKEGFELARRVLHSRVEDREIDVLDLAPESIGTFDLVLFLGVLYHMRHPLLALERVASVTRRLLILETVIDLLYVPGNALRFYPGSELNQDDSNWFGPTPSAVKAMLGSVGFVRVEMVWPSAPRLLLWRGMSLFSPKAVKRAVFHAYK
jgi:tRNA (mo5U34)-methyltransferase